MSKASSSQESLSKSSATKLRQKLVAKDQPAAAPAAQASNRQPRAAKAPSLKTVKGRRRSVPSMKAVYIWGPTLALGLIACAAYFGTSHNSKGSSATASAAQGDEYNPKRMEEQVPPDPKVAAAAVAQATSTPTIPLVFGFEIIKTYPHDPKAFTQGLLYAGQDSKKNDILYESTGLYGESTVRRVILQTGEHVLLTKNRPSVFGEGLAFVDKRKKLMQIMWQTNAANIFNSTTLKFLGQVKHGMNDGWGLTGSGNGNLYGSDGSSTLYLLDGKSFKTKRRIQVTDAKNPIVYLNELEHINGKVFANIWQTPCIARINTTTGEVDAWLVMDGLVSLAKARNSLADVLNGIAWDPVGKRLFVTGKLWPNIFQVKLVLQTAQDPAKQLQSVRSKCWPTGGFL